MPMKIVCAWCRHTLGTKPGTGHTDGICRECWLKHFPTIPYEEPKS